MNFVHRFITSLIAVLSVCYGVQTFATDLFTDDHYWEDRAEAWQDKHQYEAREHQYFADEHRWIRAEDRKAWFSENEKLLSEVRQQYAAALANMARDDEAFFKALEAPEEITRDRQQRLLLHPRYTRDALDALGPDDKAELDQLIAVLREKQAVRLDISGHSNRLPLSPRAADRYGDNQKLSALRASAVAKYLAAALNLPADRFKLSGLGDTQPLDTENSPRALARNRRVEIKVHYRESSPLLSQPIEEISPDFTPWWEDTVMNPMNTQADAFEAELSNLYLRALENSTQIRVFRDIPLIRETAILEAEGDFDPVLFMEAEFRDTDEPVGSTLRTGGPDRFKEQQLAFTAGLRKKVLTGGEIELSQRLATQQNNSVFFLPDDQALTRMRLSFTQPLLRGAGIGYNRSTVAIAKIDHSVAGDELHRQIEAHLLEIAQSYWSLYQERAHYQIGKRLVSRSAVLLDQMQGRRGVDALEVQIATARSAHAQRRAELVRTAKAIRNAEARLVTLINDPDLSFAIDFELVPKLAPLAARETIDLAEASRQALSNRPEIDQAMKQLRAGMLRARISENEMLPELNLIAGLELNGLEGRDQVGNSFSNQFDDGDPSYFVGLRMNYAIGNREAKARYQRRRIEVRQLTNQLRTTINTMQLETQVSVRESHASKRELASRFIAMQTAGEELKTLEARRDVETARGQNGSDFIARLLSAQEDLADAEKAFVSAQTSYSLSMVNLDRAMGLLLQSEGIDIERQQPEAAPPENVLSVQ